MIFPVASFLKKRYTIYSLENTRITGGLQHDRSNENGVVYFELNAGKVNPDRGYDYDRVVSLKA